MNTREKITHLECRRQKLLGELLQPSDMLSGSIKTVYRKCGKPNCWCYESKDGHAYDRLCWRDKEISATKNKSLSAHDLEWAKKCVDNYHRFKRLLDELEKIDTDLYKYLHEMMESIITKCRRNKGWV
jgi:hypothetical protein